MDIGKLSEYILNKATRKGVIVHIINGRYDRHSAFGNIIVTAFHNGKTLYIYETGWCILSPANQEFENIDNGLNELFLI